MPFLNHHRLSLNASSFDSGLMVAGRKLPLNKLAKACVFSGTVLAAAQAHAVSIDFDFPQGNSITVDEPDFGSRSLSIGVVATFDFIPPPWSDASTCTISGSITVGNLSDGLEPGVDFNLTKSSFSMTVEPRSVDGGTVFDSVADEIIFEILDDGDEDEGTESLTFQISDYGAVCDGQSVPINRGSYGWLVINDPFDERDPDVPPPVQQHKPIPPRQKSLSAQLNSLRTLTLHSSNTRDRGIAKELNRARTTTGFRADNLQVKANGQSVSVGSLMGAGAGDPLDDFGRWGMFVTGTVDAGEADKNNVDDEAKFDSSQLTVGLDYHLNNHIVVGGAVNLTAMRAGNHSFAKTDFNRSSVSVFGSFYASDAFYLDAIFSYGMSDYDLSRSIDAENDVVDSASANTDGDESSAFIGAGYNLNKQNVNVRLFTSLNYIDANVDGYQESVNGTSSAAKIDGVDMQSFTADVGAELSWNVNTNMGVFTPMLSLAYERQYADDSVHITGTFVGGLDEGNFYHQTPDRDDQYIRGQFGVSGVFRNGFSAFVSYDSYLEREDLSSGMISLGGRWQF